MRRWIFALIVSLALAPRPSSAAKLDPSTCVPVALTTSDNDVRLDHDPRPPGKPIALPKVVAEKIRSEARNMLDHAEPDLAEGLRCEWLLSPAYRIVGFGRADLFVAHIGIPTGPDFYFLILHDRSTGRVTQASPKIGAKWTELSGATDPLVQLPLVSRGRLLRGARTQVVIEERVHNGTVYNGVIYHYYDIGPNLELTRSLALEARVYSPEDHLVMRELTQTAPNRLRMDQYEALVDGNGSKKHLGSAIFKNSRKNAAFHFTEKHPEPGYRPDGIVTFCEEAKDEEYFLRHGCDFYY